MNDENGGLEPQGCAVARETLQDRGDGPVDVERLRELEEHLAQCASCRDFEQGIGAVQRALRSLPQHRFPDDALEEVWDRTVRAEPARSAGRWFGWAAAAAVLALALTALWVGGPTEPARDVARADAAAARAGEPTPEEVARAAEQARLVLGLTADALRRTEHAVVRDVLAREVSPALRRIPVRLAPPKSERRSGT